MKHQAHGWKRRKDFEIGDLVQWNHWVFSNEWHEDSRGFRMYDKCVASSLGIITRIYQSQTNCWTAEVRFFPPVVDYYITPAPDILPLGCLVKLS
jgi:hypothetical protein